MKKLLCYLIAATFLLLSAGCGQTVTVKGNSLLSDGEVKSIRVSSASEENDFEFRYAEDTQK